MQETTAPVERVMYQAHPAMFRAHPFLFIIFCLLCAAVVGLILLAIWWIRTRAVTLTVTSRCSRLQTGILSRDVKEVRHWDVRYVEVHQGFLQRLLKVGTIRLVPAAADPGAEIIVAGIPDPMTVKDLVDAGRPAVERQTPPSQ